ncbi:MAG: cobalamin adenosyltransferase [Deltaproteobacteria bacterium]|jgi:ethanolamine utilization cobalamin adenosyltransferase|nr:cobalamin adenosyltransferase [Deltaproteobacteria bacterium]
MAVLTESELRRELMNKTVRTYEIGAGTVPTPAAMDFLKERGITPIFEREPGAVKDAAFKTLPPGSFIGPNGEALDKKPEGLTHLNGRNLVAKNHPVIRFRGKLDILCAKIISAQLIGADLGNGDYVSDLEEILDFTRGLLPAELRGEPVPEFRLCSWDAQQIKERSHNPVKYFGHRHMKSTWKMGPLTVALNELRAIVRETELSAAEAFQDKSGQTQREDIIMALNRLSSLFYVLMFKYLPEGFVPQHSGI